MYSYYLQAGVNPFLVRQQEHRYLIDTIVLFSKSLSYRCLRAHKVYLSPILVTCYGKYYYQALSDLNIIVVPNFFFAACIHLRKSVIPAYIPNTVQISEFSLSAQSESKISGYSLVVINCKSRFLGKLANPQLNNIRLKR